MSACPSRSCTTLGLTPACINLFVGLRDIFGIWQWGCHLTALAEKTIQPRDGSGIAALPELYPEHDDPGVGISAAHIEDELDFFRCVLVWMTVRPVRVICEGLQRSVVALAPAVDILPVEFVTDGCFCNAML